MLGKLLSAVIDVAAFPLKVGEEVMGQMTGSDGKELKRLMPVPSDITDKLKEILENADGDIV